MVGESFSGERQSLGGRVVAVANDRSCVVQRGSYVDVFGPQLSNPTALPIGHTTDQPWPLYAVAPGARHVCRVDRSGWIELWEVAGRRQIARLDPSDRLERTFEMPLTGPSPS